MPYFYSIGSRIFAIVVSAALLAAAVGPAQSQITEREFHRGVMEGPTWLDPQYAIRPVERAIVTDLFIGLVAEDATGAIQPGAAESWKVENNGRRWIFQLREGLKWSDGRPLTAGDFVYAFQRLLAPKSTAPFAPMFHILVGAEQLHAGKTDDSSKLGVKAKGNGTLIFDLAEPTPYFPSLLVNPSAFPLRQDLIERDGDSWMHPGRMVSNGPYILGEWLPGRYIKLRKNWGFYDPASVIIDNVFYQIVDQGEVAMERFFAGELDTLSQLPREWIGELVEKSPEYLRLYPTLTTDYLVFNTKRPPFDDLRVRQALALAIDARTLVDEALDRAEIPATGMLAPGIASVRAPVQPAVESPRAVRRPDSPDRRRALAKRLLSEAGYGVRDSLRLTLHYNNNEKHRRVAAEIAEMWRKVGVRTDLYANHYAVHYGDLGLGDFDVARAGWIADFDDPMAILELLESGKERFNYGRFADERFDRMLARANGQTDPRERAIGLFRAHERAMSLFPVAPLYHHASRHLVAAGVAGWEDNVRDVHPSRFLDKPK